MISPKRSVLSELLAFHLYVVFIERKLAHLRRLCGILALIICGTCNVSFGQDFDGYQSTQSVVISTGLSAPSQIALDKQGNIYIADTGSNRILKEAPSGSTYSQSTVPSSALDGPLGVAVDTDGNVYIADSINGRVLKETLSGGTYTESVVSASGPHRRPQCLAVDTSGNVYVADPEYSALFKETPSGNSYIETVIPVQYNSSGSAASVAVDQSGNLYVTTDGGANGAVSIKLVPNGSTYSLGTELAPYYASAIAVDSAQNVFLGRDRPGIGELFPHGGLYGLYSGYTVDQSVSYPSGLAVDGSGNLFVADSKNNRILKDKILNGDFGSANIGSESPVRSVIFWNRDLNPVVMGTTAVVSQGVTGLDFTDVGTGSCTTNGPSYTYNSGQTCTVDVTFTPKFVGPRLGAVQHPNSAGNDSYAGPLQGMGVGPQISFSPAVQSKLSLKNLSSASAITSDGLGNLYIAKAFAANSASNVVVKESWNGSGYTQTTVATGLSYPVGVAVDGGGNVFIADQGASSIVEAMPSDDGYGIHTQFEDVGTIQAIAVDANQNVYFASNTLGLVKEIYQGDVVGYQSTTIAPGVFASAIAVDGKQNIYLTDNANHQVLIETFANGNYTQSVLAANLNSLRGIAVDGAANVYIADSSGGEVLKETPSAGSYIQTTLASGISGPLGLAADGKGKVYYTNDSGNSVGQIDSSTTLALNFDSTFLGQVSSDSPQIVTIANDGNAPLIFPVLSSGNNPSLSANFTWNSNATSACPGVAANSTAETLAVGATCQLPVSFSPQSIGNISGSLVLTDNTLNAAAPGYSSQTIALSGTSLAAPNFTIGASPASLSATQGAAATSVITVTAQNGFTGSVSLSASGMPTGVTATFATNPTTLSSVITLTASATATPGQSTIKITGTSGSLVATTSVALTVNVPPGITLSVAPSSQTLTSGGHATSSVTVTPSGGFTGSVALTASLTSTPSAAQNLPTLSFGSSSPVSITGATAQTASLTITTTPATSAATSNTSSPETPWGGTRNLALACLLLLGLPRRRRQWRNMLPVALSLMALTGGLLACGGGGGGNRGNPGTTPGQYTVTVTGSSGNISTTTTIAVTVQ